MARDCTSRSHFPLSTEDRRSCVLDSGPDVHLEPRTTSTFLTENTCKFPHMFSRLHIAQDLCLPPAFGFVDIIYFKDIL